MKKRKYKRRQPKEKPETREELQRQIDYLRRELKKSEAEFQGAMTAIRVFAAAH